MESRPQFFFAEFTIQKLCQAIDVNEEDILNCYLCGSRVYGTYTEESDWDFVSVVPDGFFAKFPEKSNLIDDHFISSALFEQERWKKMLIEV
jgi:predicted nucleotidyltransferase